MYIMVKLICPRCKKSFTRQMDYDRHINKKIKCMISDEPSKPNPIYECKCGTTFGRLDNLKRHIKNLHNGDLIYININTTNTINDQNNDFNGDKNNNINGNRNNINQNVYNNITIGYANMFPFGKDGIDFLTFEEKIDIMCGKYNPLEATILMVNLDDNRYDHHNVGFPDLKSGFGIIYDGKNWVCEKISIIMDVLLESKEKDLMSIYNDIKCVLSKTDNNHLEACMNNCKLIRTNPKTREMFISHIKKHLYNKRNLALNARKSMKNIKTNTPDNELNDVLHNHRFNINTNLAEAKKMHDKNIEQRKNVQIHRAMLSTILEMYHERGIVSQNEINFVDIFISEHNNLEDIKKIINVVIKKVFDNDQLFTKLTVNEAHDVNQLNDKIKMMRNIIDIYKKKNIITQPEIDYIESIVPIIRNPDTIKDITDIIIKKIFEKYDLIKEISKYELIDEDDDNDVINI